MPKRGQTPQSEINKKRAAYKRKTKLEKWGGNATWYQDLARMKVSQASSFLKEVMRNTQRRLVQLEKNVDSYAAYKLRQDLDEYNKKWGNREPDKWSIGAMLSKYHDFWASKGSTVSGAKEINYEQDVRIFGATKDAFGRERPVYRMNEEQRKNFWAAYTEFLNQNKNIPQTRDNSTRIQRILGSIGRDITPENFQTVLNTAKAMYDAELSTEHKMTEEEQEIYESIRRNLG